MNQLRTALSIRQPWAALIVHGLKKIEVRTWSTSVRGPILIHASKQPEPDPAAWSLLNTPKLMEAAALTGGIVGIVELWDCVVYRSMEEFSGDWKRHRVGPERFRPPLTFGFRLRHARPLRFHPCPGNTSFFQVRAPIRSGRPQRVGPRHPARFIVQLPEDA